MKISQMIRQLKAIQKEHGDIETSCIATNLVMRDGTPCGDMCGEHLVSQLHCYKHPTLGKTVRIKSYIA